MQRSKPSRPWWRQASSTPTGGACLVGVELRIAFVGDHHEVVAIRQREDRAPVLEVQHRAGRVAGRADHQHLAACPVRLGDRREVRDAGTVGALGQEQRRGAGEQRRALVDLVERVRHRDQRRGVAAAVDRRLREREQRLAAAVDRQHVRRRVQAARAQAVARREPGRDRLAQFRAALGLGVLRVAGGVAVQFLQHEGRRGVLGLADRQRDRRQRGRLHAVQQRGEALEGVGMQAREVRVHASARRAACGRRAALVERLADRALQ